MKAKKKNMSHQQYAKPVWHNSIQKQEKRENTSKTSGGEQRFELFDLEGVLFHKYLTILALCDVK